MIHWNRTLWGAPPFVSSDNRPRYGIIVAARTGSSRLPGKALLPLRGLPMLAYLLRRLKKSSRAGRMVLATTDLPGDDALQELAGGEGVPVFRGSRDDLVARFVAAERAYPSEYVVRVTADCPFVDGTTLDHCLAQCDAFGSFDIATTKGRYPVGVDFEVYRSDTMARLHREASLDPEEREHLTLRMYRQRERFAFRELAVPPGWPVPGRAFTVDTPDDYAFAAALADRVEGPLAAVERILLEASA
jgi:spore coat polysaccharide biosynthesis protein SpsF